MASTTPTYKQSIEASRLDDYQARYRLIRERDELREQRDALVALLRIIVHHECGGYNADVTTEDITRVTAQVAKEVRV